jgi:hypothetical protein
MKSYLPRAPPRGNGRFNMAEAKRSGVGEMLDQMIARAKERRVNQSKLGAEMRAVFRQGREDAWNHLIPAFPQIGLTREQGGSGFTDPTAYHRGFDREGGERARPNRHGTGREGKEPRHEG